MTPQEWQTIEKSLANLTLQDKLELVTRLMRTIQADVAMSPERTLEQLETLSALRRKVAGMPAPSPAADAWSEDVIEKYRRQGFTL